MEKTALIEAHQMIRTSKTDPEFVEKKQKLLEERQLFLNSVGEFSPADLLTAMGFRTVHFPAGEARSEFAPQYQPDNLLRLTFSRRDQSVRVQFDAQRGKLKDAKMKLDVYQPFPTTPEALYFLLARYNDRIRFWQRSEDLASYESQYVNNKKVK